MKKQLLFLVASVCILSAFQKINDTLSDIKATLADVKQKTLEEIGSGSFYLPSYTKEVKDACRKLPVGVREATMMSLGKIVRDYTASAAFRTDYYAWAESRYPVTKFDSTQSKWTEEKAKKTEEFEAAVNNPTLQPIYVQQLDAQSQVATSMIELFKKNPTMNMGGMTIKDFQQNADDAKMLKGLYATNKPAFAKKYAEVMAGQQLRADMSAEKQRQEEGEKKLAQVKDYTSIIKTELQQFLTGSTDIHFEAKLVAKGTTMLFADPQYEKKDGNWKFYYRCGREAVAGARGFAQSWLADLK